MFNKKKIELLEAKVEFLEETIHKIDCSLRTGKLTGPMDDGWLSLLDPVLTADEIATRLKEIYDHLGVERVKEPAKTKLVKNEETKKD